MRNAYNILVGKRDGEKPLWTRGIKMGLKEMHCVGPSGGAVWGVGLDRLDAEIMGSSPA
jgi:hypothetical protein